MSTNKNFVVKNGLDVGTTNVIDTTGKIDFTALKNRPTTLAGYGITDAANANGLAPLADPVFTGNVGVTGSVQLRNGTGSSFVYNDPNVSNFVVRTGPSTAYKWTVIDAAGNMTVPGTVSSGSGVLAVAANVIPHTGSARFHDLAAGNYGSDYNAVGLQIREYAYQGAMSGETQAAPRIGFHWGGRAACSFGMNGSQWITCWDNPGTGYSNFLAAGGFFTGDVTAYYSDMRLKTKVKDIDNARAILKQLNGFYYVENELARSFGYKNEGLQLGLSAQEVQAVLPELVKFAPFDQIPHPDPEKMGETISQSGENYLTVNYERMIPVIVEAVKEQDSIISLLLAEIKELKSKVEALEAK